jgi:hypothetical protein
LTVQYDIGSESEEEEEDGDGKSDNNKKKTTPPPPLLTPKPDLYQSSSSLSTIIPVLNKRKEIDSILTPPMLVLTLNPPQKMIQEKRGNGMDQVKKFGEIDKKSF